VVARHIYAVLDVECRATTTRPLYRNQVLTIAFANPAP